MAHDCAGQTLDFVIGSWPLTKARLTAALKSALDGDTLMISDSNPTYAAFCADEKISHEAINLSHGQRVHGAYHIQNVNAYHSRLKQ